jgi:hypothetical protein
MVESVGKTLEDAYKMKIILFISISKVEIKTKWFQSNNDFEFYAFSF